MVWTAPATATTGLALTASFWNTQVRDNLAHLRSAAKEPAQYSVGLYLLANVQTTSNTVLYVPWDAAGWNVGSPALWASASGDRISFGGATGRYMVCGVVNWNSNSSGRRRLDVEFDGGGALWDLSEIGPVTEAGAGTDQPFACVFDVTSTAQYLRIAAYQTGGTINILGALGNTFLNVYGLGA